MPILQTSRLALVPATAAHLRAELESHAALGKELNAGIPATWPRNSTIGMPFGTPSRGFSITRTKADGAFTTSSVEKAGFRYVGVGNDPFAPAGERVVRYELCRDSFSRGAATALTT
jgi:hypothetical protein